MLKDGNLFLSEINVPDVDISAGDGQVDVTVSVANGASFVETSDPDHCINDANECTTGVETAAYCYELEVIPEWTDADIRRTGPTCNEGAAVGAKEQTYQYVFPAPLDIDGFEETFSLQFFLETPGSGEFGATSYPITFSTSEDAPVRPGVGDPEVDEDTSGNGGGNGGGGGGGGGDGILQQAQQLLLLTVLLVILLQATG